MSTEQRDWHPIASKLLAETLMAGRERAHRVLGLDPNPGFDLVAARGEAKGGRGEDPAYGALLQVVSAARGLLTSRDADAMALYVHPVVVVEGDLFSLEYEGDGEEKIEPLKRAQIIWSGADSPGPLTIDIVTPRELGAHAERMKSALSRFAAHLPGRDVIPHQGRPALFIAGVGEP